MEQTVAEIGRHTALADAYELVRLSGGVMSLREKRNGEIYHPGTGPMREARELHIAGTRLVERSAAADRPLVVWDVGLGAAANAIAAFEALPDALEIHSFDLTAEPARFATRHAAELEYPQPWIHALNALTSTGEWRSPDARLRWHFHPGDFRQTMTRPGLPPPDAIFWDPYSPRSSPEIWQLEVLARLYATLVPERGCLLTSYSRSSAVRVTLLLAGFSVGAATGVGEKEEMTVAANQPGLLARPLGRDWLERVRRSANAAPLRPERPERQPITPEDLQALERHPQFSGGG